MVYRQHMVAVHPDGNHMIEVQNPESGPIYDKNYVLETYNSFFYLDFFINQLMKKS